MKKKYKISLNVIGITLIFLLMITCSYVSYLKKERKDTSLVLVENGLSVNYINGNKIKTNKSEVKYAFSVTNNSDENLYYYVQFSDIDCNKKDIKYSLIEKNNKLNIDNNDFPLNETYVSSYIEIEQGSTHAYELTIHKGKHRLNANINIGVEDISEENFAAKLLKNNEIKKEAVTKVGEEAAVINEGLIEMADDNGNSYYFRGKIDNNYVSFANNIWRIVKINGDGSIKLILNDYIDEKANFYSVDDTNAVENKLNFENVNLNTTLKNWYQANLDGFEKYIASSKYCVDDSIGQMDGENIYYLAYSRLLTDYSQVYTCLGNKYNSRIGLLTADEAVFAGATKNSDNTSYYLYSPGKDHSWWTMTPASSTATDVTYFEIGSAGALKNETIGSYYRGVKPVINLVKKTYVTGSGTEDDPYLVKE